MERSIDFRKALNDPQSVFPSPGDLVRCEALTKEQKIEVLRRWEYDASEDEVAVEEGMRDDRPSKLREILLALDELTGGFDVAHTPPTKQGGV